MGESNFPLVSYRPSCLSSVFLMTVRKRKGFSASRKLWPSYTVLFKDNFQVLQDTSERTMYMNWTNLVAYSCADEENLADYDDEDDDQTTIIMT